MSVLSLRWIEFSSRGFAPPSPSPPLFPLLRWFSIVLTYTSLSRTARIMVIIFIIFYCAWPSNMATPRPAKKTRGRSALDNVERLDGLAIVHKTITPLPPLLCKALSPFPPPPSPMQQPTPLPFHQRGADQSFVQCLSAPFLCQRKKTRSREPLECIKCLVVTSPTLGSATPLPSPQGPRALAGILPKEKGEQKSNADVPNQKPLWAIPLYAQPSRTHRPLSRW